MASVLPRHHLCLTDGSYKQTAPGRLRDELSPPRVGVHVHLHDARHPRLVDLVLRKLRISQVWMPLFSGLGSKNGGKGATEFMPTALDQRPDKMHDLGIHCPPNGGSSKGDPTRRAFKTNIRDSNMTFFPDPPFRTPLREAVGISAGLPAAPPTGPRRSGSNNITNSHHDNSNND